MIVEQKMCEQKWDKIKYEAVPSKASTKYRKAFGRHDHERYAQYLADVKSGKKEIKTGTLYPYDLVRIAMREEDETVELQWNNLPNYCTVKENALVMCDCSGSMFGGADKHLAPIDVSVSLAIYFAERNTGAFKSLV